MVDQANEALETQKQKAIARDERSRRKADEAGADEPMTQVA